MGNTTSPERETRRSSSLQFFLILLTFLLPSTARALTLDELQQQLAAYPVVRCQFEQERQISGLARPLKSRGELLVSRDHGLWWHQQKPFETTLLLDATRMVQTLPGQPTQIITAESNPQLFQFNHLLVALFRADRAVLEKNFQVSLSTNDTAGWQLVLVPRATPLNKVFRRITLAGTQHLENLVLEDMQNDRTTVRFLNHQTTPPTLTDAEKARFAESKN